MEFEKIEIAMLGMPVIFMEDFVSQGKKKRASKGDKGIVVCRFDKKDETIIKVAGKHYPIHNVPVSILSHDLTPSTISNQWQNLKSLNKVRLSQ